MTATHEDRRLGRRVAGALRRAGLALAVERVWPSVWPAMGVAFVFLGLAFADVLPGLPGWLHLLALCVFAVVFLAAALIGRRRYRPAGAFAARRRVERDSGLAHQPLAALSDDIVVGRDDAVARALWEASRARARDSVSALRVGAPDPDMARHDPLALRALAVLALAVGIGAVWSGDPALRLARAVTPELGDPAARVAEVQLWITPPPYTGAAPVTRTWSPPGPDAPAVEPAPPVEVLSVPAGSRVLARALGGLEPRLRLDAAEVPFRALDAASHDGAAAPLAYRAEIEVADAAAAEAPVALSVVSGGEPVVSWFVRVLGDRPPEVEFTAPPAAAGPRLRLPYQANDDYGVTELEVVIRHADGAELADGSTEIRTRLPRGRAEGRRVLGAPVRDFSDHPWAGTQVTVRVEAADARGQTGATEDFAMVLPFRVFNHPVARALADARRDLVQPSPLIVDRVKQTLDELSLYPKRFYDDTVVFLGMRIARARLRHDGSLHAIREIQDLLWNLAIRIEDGEYAIAEREILSAHDRLQQAMEQDADAAVIEQMMDDLARALEKFLEAAREEMERGGEEIPLDPNLEMLDADIFSQMIERARELMRLGNMDAAREMMAELGRMLQSVQSAVRGGTEMAETMRRAGEMMDKMRDLIRRQQDLLDMSFENLRRQRGAEPMPSPESGEGDPNGADAQSDLRRMLGDMMLEMDDFLGGFPPQMGDAERAMRRAQGALMDGDLPGAVRNQGDALQNLQEAMEGVTEQMAQRFGSMGRMMGQGQGPGLNPGQANDPFGRGRGGFHGASMDDGSVTVPDASEIRRAQELMHELRRRAGDRERPQLERDYIDRLLKRFR